MGIFKNIIKKVALAAAVVAGKRILSKVVTDVIDGDKKPAEVPVTSAVKPKSSSNRRRAPAKPKSEGAKPTTSRAAKPKATGANNASATDTPKKPTKPRTRKPRAAAQPKSSENKADVASTTAASHSSQSDTE